MQTIGSRLLYLIESQGDNLTSFSKKSEINYSSLSEITRDKRSLGGIILKRIADVVPDLNLNWLFLGEGNMFLYKNANNEISTFAEPKTIYNVNDPGKQMLLKYLEDEDVVAKLKEILTK